MTMPTRRLRTCVENWPECWTGGYDPYCCRFPKSCSCTIYDESRVGEDDLEPAPAAPDRPGDRDRQCALCGHAAHSSRCEHRNPGGLGCPCAKSPDRPGDRDQQQAAEGTYLTWGDWLVLDTGKHNCGVGPDGHYGAHEPGCGLEPVERVSVLLDALAPVLAEREVAARAEEAARWRAKIEALIRYAEQYDRGLIDAADLRAVVDES